MFFPRSGSVPAYYRANGRIITQQKYNVSQGNNGGYQNRPEGQQLFYAYDGLGSVAALSNHQGKLKTRYQYDAFGKVLAGDLTNNPYAFTGQRLDPESNLYHFHFRQYDAEVGVWTTADPLGVLGGINLYQYALNNPINKYDFLGLVSAGELGVGNPGSYGGENTTESMRDEFGEDKGDNPYSSKDPENSLTNNFLTSRFVKMFSHLKNTASKLGSIVGLIEGLFNLKDKEPVKTGDDAREAIDAVTGGVSDILMIPNPVEIEEGSLLDEAIDRIEQRKKQLENIDKQCN